MAHTPVHPSGEQWEIRCADATVTIVEVGGGLRDYRVGDRPVLDGYGIDDKCSSARGQTLAPWPNRLADGSYEFGGEQLQVPLTEPSAHNAIHGFVRWRSWRLLDRGPDHVTIEQLLYPRSGYPFALELRNAYRLDDGGLTITTEATNVGNRPLPYALGFHPYLKPSGRLVDDDILTAPGATYLPTDDRGLPTGREPVEGGDYDFRAGRAIGRTKLDVAFTDLVRNASGEAEVTLAAASGERMLTVWVDESFPYLELFTGDSLPDESRRRHGLGVEPMTAPPNALQSGVDLRVVQPGETVRNQWGIRTRSV